jgi:hypothetical protein
MGIVARVTFVVKRLDSPTPGALGDGSQSASVGNGEAMHYGSLKESPILNLSREGAYYTSVH